MSEVKQTPEEIKAQEYAFALEMQGKADEIAKRLSLKKVIPICLEIDGKAYIGFRKEAPRELKKAALNKLLSTAMDDLLGCGEIILDGTLLVSESCPEMSITSENDSVYLTACKECSIEISSYLASVKKK